MSLHCMLVPVQYREYENGLLRMLQIEEGKHVYHIYTFVLNADVSNRGDIGM